VTTPNAFTRITGWKCGRGGRVPLGLPLYIYEGGGYFQTWDSVCR
jgi:hypothetical protein